MTTYRCPECGHKFTINPGRAVVCPYCNPTIEDFGRPLSAANILSKRLERYVNRGRTADDIPAHLAHPVY